MAVDIFTQPHLSLGIRYEEYMQEMENQLAAAEADPPAPELRHRLEVIRLNVQRSMRLQRRHKLSPTLCAAAGNLVQPQVWRVLTETWCGDSAQSLPIIAKIADCSPLVELKILYRDEHPDIMDQHLTNGKRAIPILVAFGPEDQQLFRWGPRPRQAQRLLESLLQEGLSREEIYPKLHLWYGRDRGREIEQEWLEILGRFAKPSGK